MVFTFPGITAIWMIGLCEKRPTPAVHEYLDALRSNVTFLAPEGGMREKETPP